MPPHIKPIPGFPGYFAAIDGRIFSTKTGTLTEKKQNNSRYKRVTLCVAGKANKYYVHRLICRTFNGEPPSLNDCACHNDGEKWNNHANNLRWDSPWANSLDRLEHGTDYWNSEVHSERSRRRAQESGRLSDEDVRLIRRLRLEDGLRLREIADEFGLTVGHCHNIITGRAYSHVADDFASMAVAF